MAVALEVVEHISGPQAARYSLLEVYRILPLP